MKLTKLWRQIVLTALIMVLLAGCHHSSPSQTGTGVAVAVQSPDQGNGGLDVQPPVQGDSGQGGNCDAACLQRINSNTPYYDPNAANQSPNPYDITPQYGYTAPANP